jgi:hypothetical protein
VLGVGLRFCDLRNAVVTGSRTALPLHSDMTFELLTRKELYKDCGLCCVARSAVPCGGANTAVKYTHSCIHVLIYAVIILLLCVARFHCCVLQVV